MSVQPSIRALKVNVDVIEVVFQKGADACMLQNFVLKGIANIRYLEKLA